MVYLDKVTRIDAAADFFAQEHVPKRAITMGLQTIMKVRQFTDAFFPYLIGQAVTCSGAQLANFQIEGLSGHAQLGFVIAGHAFWKCKNVNDLHLTIPA